MQLIPKELLEIPGLLKEVYGDLAKPGCAQVGKALETVLGLGNTVLLPLQFLNERAKATFDANMERYRKKLAQTPSDEVQAVPPELGVPIVEKLTYVSDPDLTELYITLLNSASISALAARAHPSFVNIINNISPDEAKLIQCFRRMQAIPVLRARIGHPNRAEWVHEEDLLTAPEINTSVLIPSNIPAYLTNLAGLGVVTLDVRTWLIGEGLYRPIIEAHRERLEKLLQEAKADPEIQDAESPGLALNYIRGKVTLTHFGQMFLDACTSPV